MAAPTFVAQGTAVSVTGAGSVPWPAGHQADDIGILVVQSANESVATPSGWTLLDSIGTGTAGAAGATALWVFWKRATSTAEADAAVADPGDHIRARIFAVRGCETSGSPFDGSAVKAVVATGDTAVSITMPTTTGTDRYAVALVGNATDTTSNQTTIGSWSNPDLGADFTRIVNGNSTVGVGGGIDGAGGAKAAAGAISPTTSTLSTASAQAKIAFALKAPAVAPPTTVTEGGIFVATGVKTTAGAVSATTATLDTAAVQAKVSIALKPEVSAPANNPPILDAIPALVGAVGNEVQFPITVIDLDGDGVTLTLEDGVTVVPTGAALVEDEASGNFNFEWTPTSDQVGEWNFILRATDDNASPLSSTVAVVIVIRSGPVRPPFGSAVSGAVTSIS